MTEEKKIEQPIAEQKAEDQTLEKRIENVIKDVLEVKLKALEITMDKKMADLVKSKEVEMEQALRKSFGLEQDPVIHQSDLISAIRKAQLEAGDTNKRTPGPDVSLKSTGPDGNKPELSPIEKAVQDFEEAK